MANVLQCVKRLLPFVAVVLSLSAVVINLAIFQLSLQQAESADATHDENGRRKLLATTTGEVHESDPVFVEAIQQIPEVSEATLTESLQLSNLKIYVYDLPSIFTYDQLKINALHPPKIWDPKCKENFYSAKCSLHVYG